MSLTKKLARKNFRDACYKRDDFKCVMCSFKSNAENAEKDLDVHHITNPKEIVNGGYVLENGITLCHADHEKAEHYHSTGIALPNFSIDDLYKKIGSSLEKATVSANKLK